MVIHGNSNRAYNCEPIIEFPPSPVYGGLNDELSDIEDVAEEYYQAKTDRRFGFWKPENGKDMVLTNPQQQTNNLKTIFRLRTEHHAYMLPAEHKVLEQFDKKDEGDHVPYLLVRDPSCNDDDNTVKGTVLIPCRTANRGNFPLDGTYFQNNEVFADDSTSRLPVTIPRESIWGLERCTVYMGSSIHWITQDLTYEEIQDCFKNGYICVRGFDRETREPRELCATLHATQDKNKGKKRAGGDEFAVGQWVYVCLDHDFAPSRKKLPPSFYGPYPVAEKNLDRMYRLKLPQCALLDREFHVSQLKPFNGDPPTELPLLPPQWVLASRTSLGEELTKFQANYPQFKIQVKLLRDDVMFGLVYRRRSLTRLAKYGRVYVRRARPAVSK
ncbi:DNA glycosylase/AP lyase ROS1-like [Lolium perenne]|uniref:DNA glycosylase/AP lyase ROS1-like n=1 Tax=Lolium perenne TaxID=4522 RepID=UPI0021F6635A|nr:DNA glycosylase/AP lyase ROS1-like isoform X2 [Lolium perenne]